MFCQSAVLLVFSFVIPGDAWTSLPVESFVYVFGSAIIGLLAQLCLTASYQYLSATVATALTLTVCFWGIAFEVLLDRNLPSLTTLVVCTVTLPGIYLIQYPSLRKP